jgi:hypothetical protein
MRRVRRDLPSTIHPSSKECPMTIPNRRLPRLLAVYALAWLAGCASAEQRPAAPMLSALPQPAGAVVAIDEAFMPEPGFVVVHATDAEGRALVPASIGAAPLAAGWSRNIAVALSAPVQPGDRVIAMLHLDSNRPGVYEFGPASIAHDKPVMHDGRPVTATIELD